MEKRTHIRIDFNVSAFLLKEGKRIFGEVKNVCHNGIYMAVDGKHVPGEYAEISVYLLSGVSTVSVTIPGHIVRQGEDGIGFASACIDPFALLCYEALLELNRLSPPLLMEEFLDYDANKPDGQGWQ